MAMTEEETALFVGLTNIAGATSLLVKAMMQVLNEHVPHFKISLQHELDEIVVIEPYGEAIVDRARAWVANLENVV